MTGFRWNRSLLILLSCIILIEDGCLCKADNLETGISYRIRSGLDGNVLTSQYPTFGSNFTLKLGPVTTEKWQALNTQLWDVHLLYDPATNSTISQFSATDLFWLKPRAAVLNEITGIPKESKNVFELREITTDSGTYIVRDVKTDLCLKSRGAGQQISFERCEELMVAQQWDIEDPSGHKLQIKLAE